MLNPLGGLGRPFHLRGPYHRTFGVRCLRNRLTTSKFDKAITGFTEFVARLTNPALVLPSSQPM